MTHLNRQKLPENGIKIVRENFEVPETNHDSVRLTGAVYTPLEVTQTLSKKALGLFSNAKELNILEPSVGDGYFLSTIQSQSDIKHKITAVDIDEITIDDLKAHFLGESEKNISLIHQDFIEFCINNEHQKFDLIIGNPPFIRKHNYSAKFKESIQKLSDHKEYPLKDLKNAWAAFVVAAESMLNDKGVLSFIVPYEILTVVYGQKIQSEIFSKFERVDLFVPDEKAFKDIDQDAVAFVAQKKSAEEHGIYINRVRCLSDFRPLKITRVDFRKSQNVSLDLKAFLMDSETLELLHRLRKNCENVLDYCDSAPGIVTAANDFFIVTKEEALKKGLTPWTKPILKKGSYLGNSPIFSKEQFKKIEAKEPSQFIHLKGQDADTFPKRVWDYIAIGEAKELHRRYKCRHRKHWYEVPITPKTEGFFFKRSHSHPRICINEADVFVTDTAYRISPKENVSMQGLCFSFYNSLTLLFSEIDGRFYGGGVLELTPNEFKELPLCYHEPTEKEFSMFVKAHSGSYKTAENLLDFGDSWLKKDLGLTNKELSQLRSAWKIIRDHRLRHGSKTTNTYPLEA